MTCSIEECVDKQNAVSKNENKIILLLITTDESKSAVMLLPKEVHQIL